MTVSIDSPIFLYGPPASGKSALGRRLAEALQMPFIDLDNLIFQNAGQSIAEIFAAKGEAGFRMLESAALRAVIDQPAVIALGGGALLDEDNRVMVEAAGPVICLQAGFETLLRRLNSSPTSRPLLSAEAGRQLAELLAARGAHYASFDQRMTCEDAPWLELVSQVQILVGRWRVSGMGAAYDLRIAEGGLAQVGPALLRRGLRGPLAVVSDDTVAGLYAQPVLASLRSAGYTAHLLTIPPGEAAKTLHNVQQMWRFFLEGGLERGSTVLALGGGVVGDLTGFAASAYLRGVPWVVLPTTLLAMVDASLGGKTGADLPEGKNLIGAFHPPALVLADPAALESLPGAELRNGLAEVVKHGVIGDAQLFNRCAAGLAALQGDWTALVRRAAAVKLDVIERDPYERGERATLNLGHSLGHAIEVVSDYRIRHGEAVAIGMCAAARLAAGMGVCPPETPAAIVDALQGLGLPTRLPPNLPEEALLAAMGRDKKRSAGKLRLALPEYVGKVRWGVAVDDPLRLIAAAQEK